MTLSEDLLQELKDRYDHAFSMNQRFIQTLIRAVHLCAPLADGLNVLYGFNDTGRNENQNIANPTPKWCSNTRANKLHSLLLPINKKWGSIHSTSDDGNDEFEEVYTNKVFDAIDKSNLHSVAKSFFLDLNIGCAALWIDSPKEGKVAFRNISGITLMPEYSDDPECHNVWFRRVVNWNELRRISPDEANKYADKGAEYYITCGYLDMRETKGINSFVYLQFMGDDFSKPISVEESPFRRLILVNDTLRAGEARGHGVILQILEEIEYLNEITQSLKDYIKYSADPALIAPDQLLTHLDELRGAVLPSDLAAEGRPIVQPVVWNLNIPAVASMIQISEEKIRQFFNVQSLGPVNAPPNMTATEASYRQADEERQSVADLSRIANETLGGIMRTVLDILIYWEIVDVDPKKVIDFKFDSPAVDIQSQENINALLQLSELTQQVNGQGSNNLYMNPQEVYSYLATNLRTPASVNNSPQQVKSITDNMQAMAQQATGVQPEGQATQPMHEPSPLQPAEPINPTQLGGAGRISGVGF